MQTVSRSSFTTVKTEGAILPADLLGRVAEGRDLDGLRPEDYHLAPSERINEAISRSWNRLLGVWGGFERGRQGLPEGDRGTTLTRERWLLILLQELGYGRLPFVGGLEVNGSRYPVSHQWASVPVHLITFRQSLDKQDPGTRRSPHSLMQEYLNRADEALWGFLSNGLRLRVLRDNVSLTRAAYVEFDLEAMMRGELYADFALLWLVCHQSRVEVPPEAPVSDCWLEKWSQAAADQGARALDSLRGGVQEAIEVLGQGFLTHRANSDLVMALKTGDLSTQDYYRQLLRLVYRLIFLFVAEDRDLLLLPDAPDEVKRRYLDYYSVRRLRELAQGRRGSPHPDLYRGLRQVMYLLCEGYEPLGLPGLGGFLFSDRSTPAIDEADLANQDLLNAVRALAFTVENKVRRPVDYKNLGSEELGSVYESLLELHPQLNADAGTFALKVAAGSERKTTGSYYTPSSLIQCLLDSALEPVVEDRLKQAGRDAKDREVALLDIKVADPACGSGHFLIAAAHRLARHLARVRTGDEEPAPEELRSALRDVVRRCIHGVDINPMAVELCKVALWMETLDPGKPLGFLDRNIQCGNSLVGATPALLERGIPDDAFKPITGDDRKYCSEWKRRNKQQRESGQMSMFAPDLQPWERLGNLAAAMSQLDAVGDDTLDDVERQRELYERLVRSSDYRYGQLLADAWCAAFVWKKTEEFAYPITEEVFRNIECNPFNIAKWMEEKIERLRGAYQFFHWHLAFPHVFQPKQEFDEDDVNGWNGGFDVVLGNPPWEKFEVEERPFFASIRPDIAGASRAAARKKMIKKLATDNPSLYSKWLDYKSSRENMSQFFRSGSFPLTGLGKFNLYSLFSEQALKLTSAQGRYGLVVQTGIATEHTTKTFFQHVSENDLLVSLLDFENREGLFSNVHRSMRFSLLTITGAEARVEKTEFAFFLTNAQQLVDENRKFTLSARDYALINPNTRNCPVFRNRRDAQLAREVYRRVPVLENERLGTRNPWNVTIRRQFNIADDSAILRTKPQLGDETQQTEYVPLFEAKMIFLFDHRYGTFRGVDARGIARGRCRSLELAEYEDPGQEVIPRYWVPKQSWRNLLPWDYAWTIGFRWFTNATNRRTTVVSAVPSIACGDTLPCIYLPQKSRYLGPILLSNLSSYAFDFFSRQKVSGTHMNFFILKQLPALPPSSYDRTWRDFISCRGLELVYNAWSLQAFGADCGYHGPPVRWDEDRRFLLRCELDAAYFHLYDIERDDVDYIMETFPIVKRKDEAAHGGYRTKRVILEIYDEMARAMETGTPYQTRLDPPPGDPHVAHPWDEKFLGPYRPPEEWWEKGKGPVGTTDLAPLPGDRKPEQSRPTARQPVVLERPKTPPKPASKRRRKPELKSPPAPAAPLLKHRFAFTPPQGSRTERRKRVMALGRKHSIASIQELVAALADEDSTIRWLAGASLNTLGGPNVVFALLTYLDAPQGADPLARTEAVKLLGRVGDAGVRPDLERIAEDVGEDERVREAARTAVRMLT